MSTMLNYPGRDHRKWPTLLVIALLHQVGHTNQLANKTASAGQTSIFASHTKPGLVCGHDPQTAATRDALRGGILVAGKALSNPDPDDMQEFALQRSQSSLHGLAVFQPSVYTISSKASSESRTPAGPHNFKQPECVTFIVTPTTEHHVCH